jgi:hypothetical protein
MKARRGRAGEVEQIRESPWDDICSHAHSIRPIRVFALSNASHAGVKRKRPRLNRVMGRFCLISPPPKAARQLLYVLTVGVGMALTSYCGKYATIRWPKRRECVAI